MNDGRGSCHESDMNRARCRLLLTVFRRRWSGHRARRVSVSAYQGDSMFYPPQRRWSTAPPVSWRTATARNVPWKGNAWIRMYPSFEAGLTSRIGRRRDAHRRPGWFRDDPEGGSRPLVSMDTRSGIRESNDVRPAPRRRPRQRRARKGRRDSDPSVFGIRDFSPFCRALARRYNNTKCKHVYVRVRYENPLALTRLVCWLSIIRARRAMIPRWYKSISKPFLSVSLSHR